MLIECLQMSVLFNILFFFVALVQTQRLKEDQKQKEMLIDTVERLEAELRIR